MVYECLECGSCITESEEHDGWFEESHGGDESSFPLIFFPNMDVVISSANVELDEQGWLFHVIDEHWNEGEQIGILDGVGVQVLVVLARAEGSVLLWYKEEGGSFGGFWGDDSSGSQMFLNKRFAHFHFRWVERIDLGNFRSEVRMKFNGVVIGTVGRELVMGLLWKDVHKVFTPLWYG